MTASVELIAALTPLFTTDRAVTNEHLAAIAAAIDEPEALPLLSACCRAVAIRSLISAASQTNNAEAVRRAAMTLLERFDTNSAHLPADHAADIELTRRLLEHAPDEDPEQ